MHVGACVFTGVGEGGECARVCARVRPGVGGGGIIIYLYEHMNVQTFVEVSLHKR
jgi:hypothetical protein